MATVRKKAGKWIASGCTLIKTIKHTFEIPPNTIKRFSIVVIHEDLLRTNISKIESDTHPTANMIQDVVDRKALPRKRFRAWMDL
jgi:hypothetical protein